GRDRCILSKGHAATALYAVLAHRGFFPRSWLERVGRDGSRLPEHPSPGCLPGVELATGSLGHGLSVATGLALAARIRRDPGRIFVVLSDGECNEGTVWEAALLAAAHRLGRLVAVVDFNKWQATGRSEQIMALNPLRRKWEAFGWRAVEADGHDAGRLAALLRRLPKADGPPALVVAHTVKGKGVAFMEDDNNWHYKTPDDAELAAALRELGAS
ncbi:MAG: transketolase, partial [Elusimicrobia bacterium]|nr:transketolase [Elusimicrobiota bacterium]